MRKGGSGRFVYHLNIILCSRCNVMVLAIIAAGVAGGNVCPVNVSGCPSACTCSVVTDAMHVDCSSRGLRVFPDRLPNCSLIHLNISRNKLTTLEYKHYMTSVGHLDASFNAITSINKQFLSRNSARKLEYLFLENNELARVSSQEVSLLKRLKLVRIHNNRWNCRCEISHLYDWIIEVKAGSVKKIENIDSVTCFSPDDTRNRAVATLEEDDICQDKIPLWIPIVVTVCCLVYLVLMSIAGFCVVLRRRVKVIDSFKDTVRNASPN